MPNFMPRPSPGDAALTRWLAARRRSALLAARAGEGRRRRRGDRRRRGEPPLSESRLGPRDARAGEPVLLDAARGPRADLRRACLDGIAEPGRALDGGLRRAG